MSDKDSWPRRDVTLSSCHGGDEITGTKQETVPGSEQVEACSLMKVLKWESPPQPCQDLWEDDDDDDEEPSPKSLKGGSYTTMQ